MAPETASVKSRKQQNMRILIVLLVIVVICVVVAFILLYNQALTSSGSTQNFSSTVTSVTTSSSDSVSSSSASSSSSTSSVEVKEKIVIDQTPVDHYIYLAQYQGKNVLYYTDTNAKKYYEGGVEKSDPLQGNYLYLVGEDSGGGQIKYNQLTSARRIYATNKDTGIVAGLWNKPSHTVFISIYDSTTAAGTNQLIAVNLIDLASPTVWQRQINTPDSRYPKFDGAGFPQSASDDGKYVAISMWACYFCGGSQTYYTTVLNVLTKKESIIGEAGNVKFNLAASKFTYNKLQNHTQTCTPGPFCEDGTEIVVKADGEEITAALP